jgi:hypothetical protein
MTGGGCRGLLALETNDFIERYRYTQENADSY